MAKKLMSVLPHKKALMNFPIFIYCLGNVAPSRQMNASVAAMYGPLGHGWHLVALAHTIYADYRLPTTVRDE